MSKSNRTSYTVPVGWGQDQLTRFQATAIQNEFASFVHDPLWQKQLRDISEDLSRCCEYASATLGKYGDPSAQLLFLSANSHYLATVRLVASGLCLSAHATIRAAAESALYGWYLAVTPGAAQRWYDKPTDKSERRKWANEFQFSAINFALSKELKSAADWAKHIHQSTIDFGAHPNRDALYSNLTGIDRDDGSSVLRWNVLHPGGKLSIMTIKLLIETGMLAIGLFGKAYPDADQANGFTDRMAGHVQNLEKLVGQTTIFEKVPGRKPT